MSLTASRQLLQGIRGSIESSLAKIPDIKTESSELASDSISTYNSGLSTNTYSQTERETAIEAHTYANLVNLTTTKIEALLNEIKSLIDTV